MSLFDGITIAGSGISAMQTWIDTSSSNLANMNDTVTAGTPTYAEESPVFAPVGGDTASPTGEGVTVQSIAEGPTTGQVAYDPSNPIANSKGEVASPSISMSDQLVQLMEAQQSYQADASALDKAVTAYHSALTIGS